MRLSAAARVAPVWQPGTAKHVLAYVDSRGRVRIGGRVVSRAYGSPQALAWSPDGKALALATRRGVVELMVASGRTRAFHVAGVRAVAFAQDGRLALLRGNGVLLLADGHVRTLFVAPSRLAGLAWSPNGRWLLSSLPAADQWVFVQTRGGHRVLAVSHIRRQFGGEPSLDGWAPGA
jgi:WD40 repeat protein